MARKKNTSNLLPEILPQPKTDKRPAPMLVNPPPAPRMTGPCDKCIHFAPNNKLKGFWEGLCGMGNGMVRDTFTCPKWERKNG